MTNMAEGEVLGPTGNRGISSVTFGAEVTGSLASHTGLAGLPPRAGPASPTHPPRAVEAQGEVRRHRPWCFCSRSSAATASLRSVPWQSGGHGRGDPTGDHR